MGIKLLKNLLYRSNNSLLSKVGLLILLCLFNLNITSAQIGNYVSNGSFERVYNCNGSFALNKAAGWSNIGADTTAIGGVLYSTGPTTNCTNAPVTDVGFQYPRTGTKFARTTFYCINPCPYYASRGYPKNRLKANLIQNKTYCVKMYVCLENDSPYATSNFGFYFSDNSTDTIKYSNGPITYLSPQVSNPGINIIPDTLNWVPVTGTFVATGNEKYLVIGNYESNAATTKSLVIPNYTINYTYNWSEYFIDDISCIEINLPAYAGPDKSVVPGDSVFIGREHDFATDSGCTWYKFPNMTTAIDTVSGLWVKPTVTTTYIVKQLLDCSSLKWDTVVIYMNPLGIFHSSGVENDIKLFPVPAFDYIELANNNEALIKDFKTLSIFNNLGQLIREEEISFKEKKIIISTSDLAEGVYSLLLKSNHSGTVSKRFVISH